VIHQLLLLRLFLRMLPPAPCYPVQAHSLRLQFRLPEERRMFFAMRLLRIVPRFIVRMLPCYCLHFLHSWDYGTEAESPQSSGPDSRQLFPRLCGCLESQRIGCHHHIRLHLFDKHLDCRRRGQPPSLPMTMGIFAGNSVPLGLAGLISPDAFV